ncbi:MAG: ferritin family protein [Polyangiaceae bacterium]
MTFTVAQAVRNAVAAEKAAAQFYRALAVLDVSPEVRGFFLEMAEQEDQHAAAIEAGGKRLVGAQLPAQANMEVRGVETAPEWLIANDISPEQALQLARDNEYKASLFYDSLADFCPEPEAGFFRQLAMTEIEHAKLLDEVEI